MKQLNFRNSTLNIKFNNVNFKYILLFYIIVIIIYIFYEMKVKNYLFLPKWKCLIENTENPFPNSKHV